MSAADDPALETLWLPFLGGDLAWPTQGGALLLRARAGWPLHQRDWAGLVATQHFRPQAQALETAGIPLVDEDDASVKYPLVLVLPPRQRDEARALYARAIARTAPGGRIVACVANTEGARSAEQDLARIAGPLTTRSKNKCRVFWTAPLDGSPEPALFAEWEHLDAPRAIAGGRFLSRPGLFAWDRIDPASALLAKHLPTDLAGRAADLGAGFGVLADALLQRCKRITSLDLYEADARGLELARQNLGEARVPLAFHWHDVTTGIPGRYDVIVSNPPFHAQGRADRPDLGRRFIDIAADALAPGGRLWLVANRHLPYEEVLASRFEQARVVEDARGFKVIEGRNPQKTRSAR